MEGCNWPAGWYWRNDNRMLLLQLFCSNALCIMNTFFQHRNLHKYTWSLCQRSFIDFCSCSFPYRFELLGPTKERIASTGLTNRVKQTTTVEIIYHISPANTRLNVYIGLYTFRPWACGDCHSDVCSWVQIYWWQILNNWRHRTTTTLHRFRWPVPINVLNIRVKRVQLSTDHHLVVCNLHLESPTAHSPTCKTKRFHLIKWEALANKQVRRTIADIALHLLGELAECTADAKLEWQLYKAAVASSASRLRGRLVWRIMAKSNLVESGGERLCSSKESITYKVWLHNKAESSLLARYTEAWKSTAFTVKKTKIQSCDNFSHKLRSNHTNKVLRQTTRRFHGKNTLLDPPKT